MDKGKNETRAKAKIDHIKGLNLNKTQKSLTFLYYESSELSFSSLTNYSQIKLCMNNLKCPNSTQRINKEKKNVNIQT